VDDLCLISCCFEICHVAVMIECGNSLIGFVWVARGIYCASHINMCFGSIGSLTNPEHESVIYHYLG
jgi:hypothetical protein